LQNIHLRTIFSLSDAKYQGKINVRAFVYVAVVQAVNFIASRLRLMEKALSYVAMSSRGRFDAFTCKGHISVDFDLVSTFVFYPFRLIQLRPFAISFFRKCIDLELTQVSYICT